MPLTTITHSSTQLPMKVFSKPLIADSSIIVERVMAIWNGSYSNHPTLPIKVKRGFPLFIDTSVSINYDSLPTPALNQSETIPKQFIFNIEERAKLNNPNYNMPVKDFFKKKVKNIFLSMC